MKKMDDSGSYGDDGSYRIVDCGNYYLITIASDKANAMRTYEYDAVCGSLAEVEKELQRNSYEQIKKLYHEQCVYCECEEQIW